MRNVFGDVLYTDGRRGCMADFSTLSYTVFGTRKVERWIRWFLRSSHPGRERHTSSIQVTFRALKKFFFTNPTEFSIGPLLSGSAFNKRPSYELDFIIEEPLVTYLQKKFHTALIRLNGENRPALTAIYSFGLYLLFKGFTRNNIL